MIGKPKLLVLILIAMVGSVEMVELQAQERLWTEKPQPTGLSHDTPVTMGAFVKLAKELSPAVVHVDVKKKGRGPTMDWGPFGLPFPMKPYFRPNTGMGTGFVIHRSGWVLTNNHVIENAEEIKVTLHNKATYFGKVVGADPRTDIALVKIEPKETLSVAPLGNSDALEIGEWVVAIGNPFGLDHTVTAGIVSAKGRKDIAPQGRHLLANFIQTDASINPGNSGGPLINIRGEVVGINSAINAAGQGIGFAIPINMAKKLVPQLRHGRLERSWIGVMIQPVTRELAMSLGLDRPRGALITEVVRSSPAAAAGLKPGDVVLDFDGRPIGDASDLSWLASTKGVGKKVQLVIFRDRKEVAKSITLGRFPESGAMTGGQRIPEVSSASKARGLGIHVSGITPRMRERLGLKGAQGVVVVDIEPNSPAFEAGLRRYDVVLKIGDDDIQSTRDFSRAVSKIPKRGIVRIFAQRADRRLFLAFQR